MGLEHILWNEPLVLPKAGAHHRKGRCLHTTDGVSAAPCGYREGLRTVDTDEPVGFAAGLGGKVVVIVFRPVFQISQPFTDSLVGERTDPKAVKRHGASDMVVQVAEN